MENKLLILITTYSRGENLPAVVESIVKQTFKNYKILICDDHSPNDPTEIINGTKSKYPNVNIESYRNPINIGESININIALGKEFHNGFKYLVLLQDDTVYTDDKFLNNGIQLLEQNPDAAYFGGLFYKNKIPGRLLNFPGNSPILKVDGINFWRMWGAIDIHWAGCIFPYIDTLKYRFGVSPRKDVTNGDSLFLLRMAMKSFIILYNKNIIDVEFNKTGDGYERFYTNPVDRFIKVEKYYRFAAESAVEHGVSKEEATDWWLNKHTIPLALLTINRIGNNKELLRNFIATLKNYDIAISTSVLNFILNSAIR